MDIVLFFLIAFVFSVIAVPLMIKLCFKKGFLDEPSERKVHFKAVPRLGGFAVAFSFLITLCIALVVNHSFMAFFNPELLGFFVSVLLLIILGALDDIFEVRPYYKFSIEILIAFILFWSGVRVEVFSNPFGPNEINLSFFASLLFTVIWVVGIINAINMIDGLDGLACGVAFIAGLCLLSVCIYLKSSVPIILLSILCGSVLGFLIFNFPPAKIFLGDTGSMFIGFILAYSSMIGFQYKTATAAALLIPVCALALPVSDCFIAAGRRLLNKKSIFIADKKHLHHRLLQLGLSQKQVIMAFYLATLYFGGISFLFVLMPQSLAFTLLVFMWAGLFAGIRMIGFIERRIRLNIR